MSEVKMEVTLSILTCGECGMQFAVPLWWERERREDHKGWNCPNGHPLVFSAESTLERTQRQKRETELALQAQINEERHLRLVAEKAHESEKRKRRKIEKRIAAGVCPCCNRTFDDLHRHMSTKHKNYALPPGSQKKIEGTIQ